MSGKPINGALSAATWRDLWALQRAMTAEKCLASHCETQHDSKELSDCPACVELRGYIQKGL